MIWHHISNRMCLVSNILRPRDYHDRLHLPIFSIFLTNYHKSSVSSTGIEGEFDLDATTLNGCLPLRLYNRSEWMCNVAIVMVKSGI